MAWVGPGGLEQGCTVARAGDCVAVFFLVAADMQRSRPKILRELWKMQVLYFLEVLKGTG